MPFHPTLVLVFTLAAAVRAIPVDEISARNGIGSASSGVGGQAPGGSVFSSSNSCTGSTINCVVPNLSAISLTKIDSGNYAKVFSFSSHVSVTFLADNAGNGGSALSGASSGAALHSPVGGNYSAKKVLVGSAFSGAGGEAPGGSVVDNHPALIELDSDNAGEGGAASSGNSSGVVS